MKFNVSWTKLKELFGIEIRNRSPSYICISKFISNQFLIKFIISTSLFIILLKKFIFLNILQLRMLFKAILRTF